MIKIIADSTCDLPEELIKKYDIDILPLYVHMGEKEYKDKLDITSEEIFAWSDETKETPKTSAPSIEDAIKALEPYKENGDDVIMFAISEDISASANVMRLAAEDLEYEDHVYVINSQNLSTGISQLIVEAAVRARKKNADVKEIVEIVNSLRPYVRTSFVVDTLTYLHRGGRCSATAALVGGVLKLKPEIVVTDGVMDSDKKFRGKIEKVMMQYVKTLEEELKHAKKDRVFITHSSCSDEIINQIKDYLESLNRFEKIYIAKTGSVISSHCGPGTLGIIFMAGGDSFGPYDKEFDSNHNGIMEEDEKAAEAAYIRHLVEKENADKDSEEEEY